MLRSTRATAPALAPALGLAALLWMAPLHPQAVAAAAGSASAPAASHCAAGAAATPQPDSDAADPTGACLLHCTTAAHVLLSPAAQPAPPMPGGIAAAPAASLAAPFHPVHVALRGRTPPARSPLRTTGVLRL